MNELRLKARAKVNLGLDVVRRREDGYHEVRMIMQTVALCDQLLLKKTKEQGIRLLLGEHSYVPSDEGNLAYRAAALLFEEFKPVSGLEIHLEKHIPVAAGLAGGSSDAAAVLFGINRLFHLGLSLEELQDRGVKIGADVPYCIMRGTALAEGIGEKLTRLPKAPPCTVLLAKPPVSLSTKWVYQNLKVQELTSHPDIDGQICALEEGNLKDLAAKMQNVLETVSVPAHPEIGRIRDIMKENGALNAMMSGSGPTVFGLFEEMENAERCRDIIRREDLARDVHVTRFTQ